MVESEWKISKRGKREIDLNLHVEWGVCHSVLGHLLAVQGPHCVRPAHHRRGGGRGEIEIILFGHI